MPGLRLEDQPIQAPRMMKTILGLTMVIATLAATVPSASADGSRRLWRGSSYPVGLISRNVVTPYYYGYYGSHYSYVAPDPVPGPTYYVYPPVACWSLSFSYWFC